jgi:hypothetical protein
MLLIDIFQTYVDDKITSKQTIDQAMKEYNDTSYNLIKAITECSSECGCINSKNIIELDLNNINYDYLLNLYLNTACDKCRKKIEYHIGKCILSITSLCSLCGINIADIFIKEHRNIEQYYSKI